MAAVSPWNISVVLPVRKVAPAMGCGNTVVFKPASLSPWTAVCLVRLLEKAGLVPGVLDLATGRSSGQADSSRPWSSRTNMRYGLAALLFRSQMELAGAFVRKVRTGIIHVNHGTASQAHIPLGGVKDSGQGAYSIRAHGKRYLY